MKYQDIYEAQEDIDKLAQAVVKIDTKAASEHRQPTEEEQALKAEVAEEVTRLRGVIQDMKPGQSLTLERSSLGSRITPELNKGTPFALHGPGQPKDYRSLFGSKHDSVWQDRNVDFFQAVFSGRHHPELIRAAMNETSPSDGGFLIPTEYASRIHAVALENEIVAPRAYVQPMISNELHLPGLVVGDHSASLFGGFTATYAPEAGTINEHDPKARMMVLMAKKLVGLIRFSSELATDIPGGMDQIINLCGRGLGWFRDKFFLHGTGAGQPQGIMNASCLITVTPQSGEHKHIEYADLVNMMSRMYAGSFANSVWVCHQSTIPELLQLNIAVGTAGTWIPVMTQANGGFEILTRPVIFTEKTAALGSVGDIMLVDFSQYIIGLRQEMRFDTSIHVAFSTDEIYSRIIERHDGQPLWDQALTLADGSTTVSPFIALGVRT